jgi:formylglycine-generating enzyme required for sulfatase activity
MNKRLLGTLAAFAVASLAIMAVARAAEDRATAKQPKELTLDCGNGVLMQLALIPAGEFMMGSPENEPGRSSNEGPQHRVRITKPFFMDVNLVTQAQYDALMGGNSSYKNPSCFPGENNPEETVDWDQAAAFCEALSKKTGQTVRLPTEAEWEYACRAGATTPFNTGETISADQANYDGHYTYGTGQKGINRRQTVAVGSFAPNAFGLYDMHGNLWEWCQDWYDGAYYKNSPTDDPPGPPSGQSHVMRGGSWADAPTSCRSAHRVREAPGVKGSYYTGFRVVCEPKP